MNETRNVEAEEALLDAIRDNFSPEGVAALAQAIDGEAADSRVVWFRETLRNMLAGQMDEATAEFERLGDADDWKFTIENSGMINCIYATRADGQIERVAEVVNMKLCQALIANRR